MICCSSLYILFYTFHLSPLRLFPFGIASSSSSPRSLGPATRLSFSRMILFIGRSRTFMVQATSVASIFHDNDDFVHRHTKYKSLTCSSSCDCHALLVECRYESNNSFPLGITHRCTTSTRERMNRTRHEFQQRRLFSRLLQQKASFFTIFPI